MIACPKLLRSHELMALYDPAGYGEAHAEAYDEIYANAFATDVASERLATLANDRDGTLLDLGIGTGRLAMPLRKMGIDVHGIDASPAMIARLRAQRETADVPIWQTDLADFSLPYSYAVIVCAVSTLFMLPDRQRQIDCLNCAANHLQPDGILVVEAFVPNPRRYDSLGERTELRNLGNNSLHLVLSHHDAVDESVRITHVLAGSDGVRSYAVTLHYAWPSELDLMARTAGLELVERLGGWDGRPYDATTTDHITMYQTERFRPSLP